MNPSFHTLIQTLESASRIAILTHQGPDGDGVGAMFGLYHTLNNSNRTVIPVTNSRPNTPLTCIPCVGHLSHNADLENIDLIVTVDAGEPDRIEFYDRNAYAHKTLNIDHHPSERFANLNYLDEGVSSTSEIIATLFLKTKRPISAEAATSLLVGIFFDTGGFQHNTSAETFSIIAHLLRNGAHLKRVVEYLNHSTTPEALKIWGQTLQNLSVEQSTSLAHSCIPHSVLKEHHISPKELQLDKLVQIIGSVSEASFGMLATEHKEQSFKGSFRTDAFKNVNVEHIARQLGGGGHIYASGFRYNGSYSSLLTDIQNARQNML